MDFCVPCTNNVTLHRLICRVNNVKIDVCLNPCTTDNIKHHMMVIYCGKCVKACIKHKHTRPTHVCSRIERTTGNSQDLNLWLYTVVWEKKFSGCQLLSWHFLEKQYFSWWNWMIGRALRVGEPFLCHNMLFLRGGLFIDWYASANILWVFLLSDP